MCAPNAGPAIGAYNDARPTIGPPVWVIFAAISATVSGSAFSVPGGGIARPSCHVTASGATFHIFAARAFS